LLSVYCTIVSFNNSKIRMVHLCLIRCVVVTYMLRLEVHIVISDLEMNTNQIDQASIVPIDIMISISSSHTMISDEPCFTFLLC
jgi:hypothetical protein